MKSASELSSLKKNSKCWDQNARLNEARVQPTDVDPS